MESYVMAAQTDLNCASHPQAPECANPPTGATTAVMATSGSVIQATGMTMQTDAVTKSSAGVAALVTSVWTSVFTNNDGSSYTTISTEVVTASTTSVISTSARTTIQAVITDPPEAQSVSHSSGNGGVSKGAVAGIAIGTCIVGAAIAFIAAWLLFKRRDRKFIQKTCPSGYPIYADSSPELVMVQKSAASGNPYVQVSQTQMRTPVPVPARASAASPTAASDALAGILPPAATEHEVGMRISALFTEVKRHVDTYYRDVHASITPSMDSDLASFGKDVNMLELLQNCSHPTIALKHALTAYVLTLTGPKQDGSKSTLWPADLASFTNGQDADPPHLATAQALHRRLTVHIYTQRTTPSSQNPSQSRLSNPSALSVPLKTSSAIREAAEHFSLTFFPWANPTFGDQEREIDLTSILSEALETRIWLAGQTSEWGFEWEIPGRGAVVVSPGLVVRGEGRGPRRVVLEQSVVSI